MEDFGKERTFDESPKSGRVLWHKPLRLFLPHFACLYLVVLAPIALHHVYACVVGADSFSPRGNDTFSFLSDVLELCFLLMGWGEYAATPVRASRLALCALSLVSTAFAWCLCAHMAASCLTRTEPSLKRSLKVASRAFSRVASTAMVAVLPFIILILSVAAVCLAVFLTYTGAEAPWIPRLESAAERFTEKHFAVSVSLSVVFQLVALLGVSLLSSSTFAFSLVAAAVDRNTYGFSALTESAKLARGLFPFLAWTSMLNWSSVNYPWFAVAVKKQLVFGIVLEVLLVSYMVFFKVIAIFMICIVYFHARTAPVNGDDLDGKKKWFTAKLRRSCFEADNKSLMYDVVADFDDSMKDDAFDSLLKDNGKV